MKNTTTVVATSGRTCDTIGRARKRLIQISIVVAVLLMVSFGSTYAQGSPGLLISADWLSAHLSDPEVVVLHAGMQRARYQSGHIPGAHFLDMSQVIWDGDPAWGFEITSPAEIEAALENAGVTEQHHLVVYAANSLYASRLFMTLEVMGLEGRVSMLDGGFGGWQEDAREVSMDDPEVVPGDIELALQSDILVSADWINERLNVDRVALIDARPDNEYTGEDGGLGGRVNPGHIPGGVQMYWENLIESRPVPRLHERSELRTLFNDAGADDGDTVVAYCMVGMRASFTYFAARLLGYETKFYDGSWRDWGAREDLPYVTGTSPH